MMKLFSELISSFRKSLFLKVFSLSALVSLILISAIGSTLFNRLEDGIYKEKIAAAISEGRAAIQFAQYRFTIESLNAKPNFLALSEEILKSTNISAEESGREVALFNVRGQKSRDVPAIATSNFLEPNSIPSSLRKEITEKDEISWETGTLRYINNREIPGIFIGRVIEIPKLGKYEMYVAYDFVAQQRSIDLIGRSLWFTGFLLLVLILLTASFVLKISVKPIQVEIGRAHV